MACSSDDNERMVEPTKPTEPTQDYTSFIFEAPEATFYTLENCVAGYYTNDGFCKEVAVLGGIHYEKPSEEVKLTSHNITEIHIFTDLFDVVRLDTVFKLEQNKLNILVLKGKIKGIPVDKKDPKEYPH